MYSYFRGVGRSRCTYREKRIKKYYSYFSWEGVESCTTYYRKINVIPKEKFRIIFLYKIQWRKGYIQLALYLFLLEHSCE